MITPHIITLMFTNLSIFIIFLLSYYIYRLYRIYRLEYMLKQLPKYGADYNQTSKELQKIIAELKYEYPLWDLDDLLYHNNKKNI